MVDNDVFIIDRSTDEKCDPIDQKFIILLFQTFKYWWRARHKFINWVYAMKILNFYLLAINVVIVNAQHIRLSVRVVKYKDANDNVVTLADTDGIDMDLRFLNADTEEDNRVEVS